MALALRQPLYAAAAAERGRQHELPLEQHRLDVMCRGLAVDSGAMCADASLAKCAALWANQCVTLTAAEVDAYPKPKPKPKPKPNPNPNPNA